MVCEDAVHKKLYPELRETVVETGINIIKSATD